MRGVAKPGRRGSPDPRVRVDDLQEPLVEAAAGHRDTHVLAKHRVLAVRVRREREIQEALKLDKRCRACGLAQLAVCEVEEVREVGRVREEEAPLERAQARHELLVFQQELEQRPVRVGVRVLDELVQSMQGRKRQFNWHYTGRTHFSSSMENSSSAACLGSAATSIPHSRITLRYLPASRILCFHPSKRGGTQAPPGSRPPTARGGGTPSWRFDGPVSVDPSRSCAVANQHTPFTLRGCTSAPCTAAPSTRPYSPSRACRGR